MYIETYSNAMPQNLLPHSVTKILLPSSRPDSVPQRSTHHAASVVWACTASDGFFLMEKVLYLYQLEDKLHFKKLSTEISQTTCIFRLVFVA